MSKKLSVAIAAAFLLCVSIVVIRFGANQGTVSTYNEPQDPPSPEWDRMLAAARAREAIAPPNDRLAFSMTTTDAPPLVSPVDLPPGWAYMGDNMYRSPNGDWLGTDIEPPVVPGATSVTAFRTFEKELAGEIRNGLDPNKRFDAIFACKEALLARVGALDARYTFTLGMHYVADGHTLRVADLVAPEGMWPSIFDESDIACWTAAFVGVSFPSARKFDRVIEDSFCVNP